MKLKFYLNGLFMRSYINLHNNPTHEDNCKENENVMSKISEIGDPFFCGLNVGSK